VHTYKGKLLGSGPGTDGMQAVLIKRTLSVILPVLVHIFNKVIRNGA
jgi:hypothetical protein